MEGTRELRRTSRIARPSAVAVASAANEVAATRPRRDNPARTSPVSNLPPELLREIITYLPSSALLSLTLVSRYLRSTLLNHSALPLWHRAREREDLGAELSSWLQTGEVKGELGMANLLWGKRCRSCGKSNARKVDYFLRVRLCAGCWKTDIVIEFPDEPDPAFVGYFMLTKRYTPRARTGRNWRNQQTFFYIPSLSSTSSYLESLFPPSIIDSDPSIDPNDRYAVQEAYEQVVLNPPEEVKEELERRARWLREVWKDGETLREWETERKKREKEEAKELQGGKAGADS